MKTSFDITSLVPTASWQFEKMILLRDIDSGIALKNALTAEICTTFEPYTRHVARSWWARYCRIHGKSGLDDIESAGRQGMLISIQNWDPSYGKPLVHFASRWISGSCQSEAISLSQGVCSLPKKVRRLSREYHGLGETGAVDQQARLLQGSNSRLNTERLIRYFGQRDPDFKMGLDLSVSLSRNLHPAIRDLAAPDTIPADVAERNEEMETIRAVLMKSCSPRERLIFFIQFPNMPLSGSDVGLVETKNGDPIPRSAFENGQVDGRQSTAGILLGVSRERVRQLWEGILAKIRTRMNSGRRPKECVVSTKSALITR